MYHLLLRTVNTLTHDDGTDKSFGVDDIIKFVNMIWIIYFGSKFIFSSKIPIFFALIGLQVIWWNKNFFNIFFKEISSAQNGRLKME